MSISYMVYTEQGQGAVLDFINAIDEFDACRKATALYNEAAIVKAMSTDYSQRIGTICVEIF